MNDHTKSRIGMGDPYSDMSKSRVQSRNTVVRTKDMPMALPSKQGIANIPAGYKLHGTSM